MKNKFLVLLFLSVFVPFNASSQVSLSVDSLIVDDVVWISRRDVWIEDFAYGPKLSFVCSLTNNSDDTILVDIKNGVTFEFDSRKHYHKKIWVDYTGNDTVISIPSYSQVQINGHLYVYFLLKGKNIVRDNYMVVNYLPSMSKLIKKSHVAIRTGSQRSLIAAIQNCFVGRNFFRDYTLDESIFDIGVEN